MVGFRDLVGTDIAPVSKKPAVKGDELMSKYRVVHGVLTAAHLRTYKEQLRL